MDPDLVAALHANSLVTGFVTYLVVLLLFMLVLQMVYTKNHIKLDDVKKKKAQPKIDDWYNKGTIIPAPSGCLFNNPVVLPPKKDDDGNYTNVRVCLDTRRLNKALVTGDKFPLTSYSSFYG